MALELPPLKDTPKPVANPNHEPVFKALQDEDILKGVVAASTGFALGTSWAIVESAQPTAPNTDRQEPNLTLVEGGGALVGTPLVFALATVAVINAVRYKVHRQNLKRFNERRGEIESIASAYCFLKTTKNN